MLLDLYQRGRGEIKAYVRVVRVCVWGGAGTREWSVTEDYWR